MTLIGCRPESLLIGLTRQDRTSELLVSAIRVAAQFIDQLRRRPQVTGSESSGESGIDGSQPVAGIAHPTLAAP